ncbi:MAG TPA: fumarylacetoacetate hydrolase family protein [Vicinamibacterales bacterium]
MHLYRLATSILVNDSGRWFRLTDPWDAVVNRDDLAAWLREQVAGMKPLTGTPDLTGLQPPIQSQEVWAAGVTYYRSRTARMEEAKSAGGGDFYDRVYEAERPELFFKATPHRVRGHQQPVRLRSDGKWNVPEPELTLMVTSGGRIVGYTIGNDMSSRDIEGENPLYLPQAKVYDGSCALGPGLLVTEEPLPPSTEIVLTIARGGAPVYEGRTTLEAMRRTPEELVRFLFRDNTFPAGCLLLTGTGIVPPDDFTLAPGDEISIAIEPIGTLVNVVA